MKRSEVLPTTESASCGEEHSPASVAIAFEFKAPLRGLAFGADFLLHRFADDQVPPGEIGQHAIVHGEPEPIKTRLGEGLLEHRLVARELASGPTKLERATLGIAARARIETRGLPDDGARRSEQLSVRGARHRRIVRGLAEVRYVSKVIALRVVGGGIIGQPNPSPQRPQRPQRFSSNRFCCTIQ